MGYSVKHRIKINHINSELTNNAVPKRLPTEINYAASAIDGLQQVLLQFQPEPLCFNPYIPVLGWELLTTLLQKETKEFGYPLNEHLGTRVVILDKNKVGRIHQVLMVPRMRGSLRGDQKCIDEQRTSAEELLDRDPALYPDILRAINGLAAALSLNYVVDELHFPPNEL